ncbi:hypothetical protein IWX49DRAFT_324848 [Phyllosticta citricarpa]|uniref:Secreted protein n=1 Tax=Phyllosticta citricarpa TaxID=55181 RepID=A0ABR1LMT6_9PEZI
MLRFMSVVRLLFTFASLPLNPFPLQARSSGISGCVSCLHLQDNLQSFVPSRYGGRGGTPCWSWHDADGAVYKARPRLATAATVVVSTTRSHTSTRAPRLRQQSPCPHCQRRQRKQQQRAACHHRPRSHPSSQAPPPTWSAQAQS